MKNFKYFNINKIKIDKGWKIHLSPFLKDADNAEKKFLDWINKNDTELPFKIMNKELYYNVLFPPDRTLSSQIGKYITIYPSSEKHFLYLLEKFYDLFKGWKGITPISDRQYKNSSFINYRYGIFIKKNDIEEYRGNKNFSLPDKVIDKTGYKPKKFLKGFHFKKMIRDSNFGSVFIVSDIKDKNFIVKDGRLGIGINEKLTSFVMRENEWNILNLYPIGPKPIKKEVYLDHNFYVYEFINKKKEYIFMLSDKEFKKIYHEWKSAIIDFENNVINHINFADFNISNFILYDKKILFLDCKFVSRKNYKTLMSSDMLSGPLKKWKSLNQKEKINTLYISLLSGIYASSLKTINYKTLVFLYKRKLNILRLSDPLKINDIKILNKKFIKSEFCIKNIVHLSLEEVKIKWEKYYDASTALIEVKNESKMSPWLDMGTLNLIFWTIKFSKNKLLILEDFSEKIINAFEKIINYPTYKTDIYHGIRGVLHVFEMLPNKIKEIINIDLKDIQEYISILESLK